MRFIGVLASIAGLGFIASAFQFVELGVSIANLHVVLEIDQLLRSLGQQSWSEHLIL